jgi:large subunit ribosomal protein L7/L12
MNMMKKAFAVVAVAATLFSSSAFANPAGEAKVRAAGEGTVAKVEEALTLTKSGADKTQILNVMSDIRQLQKEFRYEQTERLRQKAGDRMKVARDEVEKGEASAADSLQSALDLYKEMLKIYNAAH